MKSMRGIGGFEVLKSASCTLSSVSSGMGELSSEYCHPEEWPIVPSSGQAALSVLLEAQSGIGWDRNAVLW